VQSAIDVNYRQRLRVVGKLQDHLKVLRGTTIGLLGLAFKANTDDLRDAPAITLAQHLIERGAVVRAHDPIAMQHCSEHYPDLEATYADDELELARGCDAVVVVTEWDQYKHLDWDAIREAMRGTVVLDARNVLRADTVRAAGLTYVGIGR